MTRREALDLRSYMEDTTRTLRRNVSKLKVLLSDKFPCEPGTDWWGKFLEQTLKDWKGLMTRLILMLRDRKTAWSPTEATIDPYSRSQIVPNPGEDWKQDVKHNREHYWAYDVDNGFPEEARDGISACLEARIAKKRQK